MFNSSVLIGWVGRADWSAFEYWLRGYKTFFILNSAEQEIYPAHKC